MSDPIDWAPISAALRAPFDPHMVEFMAKGKVSDGGRSQVVAYVDARCVQDRLDDVVGAGAWTFDWQPISTDGKGDITVAKGTLTIHGVAKSDVGTASTFEASLGCVSHALKRAAVQWGVGRYLYDLEKTWVALDKGRIPDATLATLRAKLPRPDGTPATMAPAPRQKPVAQPQPPQAVTPAPTSQRQPAPAQRDAGRPTVAPADDGEPVHPLKAPVDTQAKTIARLCANLGKSTPVYRTFDEAASLIALLSDEVKRAQAAATNDHDLRETFPAGQRGA